MYALVTKKNFYKGADGFTS